MIKKILLISLILVVLCSVSFSMNEKYANFSVEQKQDVIKEKAFNMELAAILIAIGVYGLQMENKTDYEYVSASALTVLGGYFFTYQLIEIAF
jgi:hypothetical protein